MVDRSPIFFFLSMNRMKFVKFSVFGVFMPWSFVVEQLKGLGAENLPSEIYATLGQAATVKRLKKFEKAEKDLRDGYKSQKNIMVLNQS